MGHVDVIAALFAGGGVEGSGGEGGARPGADPNARDADGCTPLHLAAEVGSSNDVAHTIGSLQDYE